MVQSIPFFTEVVTGSNPVSPTKDSQIWLSFFIPLSLREMQKEFKYRFIISLVLIIPVLFFYGAANNSGGMALVYLFPVIFMVLIAYFVYFLFAVNINNKLIVNLSPALLLVIVYFLNLDYLGVYYLPVILVLVVNSFMLVYEKDKEREQSQEN